MFIHENKDLQIYHPDFPNIDTITITRSSDNLYWMSKDIFISLANIYFIASPNTVYDGNDEYNTDITSDIGHNIIEFPEVRHNQSLQVDEDIILNIKYKKSNNNSFSVLEMDNMNMMGIVIIMILIKKKALIMLVLIMVIFKTEILIAVNMLLI